MLVIRMSPLTGVVNTREMDVTEGQLLQWCSGMTLIQRAMPHLPPEDREFLITGYTPEDWAVMFPPEEEEE